MQTEINAALSTAHVLAMPTAPTPAFRLGEKTSDPLQMYLSDIFTTPPSLTGHPAISLPVGQIDGLPAGMQLVGRIREEATLFKFGAAIEQGSGPIPAANQGSVHTGS
jgi:aspartyl-tRNA(Asn)/glutamyl-tRNA(Gln) amidotransferase subunit A